MPSSFHTHGVLCLGDAECEQKWQRNGGVGCCLFHACRMGHIKIVCSLIEANADIEQGNSCGTSPLHIAAQSGHVDVVRCLVRLGANPEIMNIKSRTPLISAIHRGYPEVVRLLLRSSARVEGDVWKADPLYTGQLHRRHTALWHHLADYTPLCIACAAGDHVAILRLLPFASRHHLQQAKMHAQDERQYDVAHHMQCISDVGGYAMYVRNSQVALAGVRALLIRCRALVSPDINLWLGSTLVADLSLRIDLECSLARLLNAIFTLPIDAFVRVIKFHL